MPEDNGRTMARRVELTVTIDGHDATDFVNPSLVDFTYTDQMSGKADEVQLRLHDRDGNWRGDWMPKKGMPVTAEIVTHDWENDGEDMRLPCGTFKIDEIEFSGPPMQVTIKAVSAAMTTGIRDTKKNKGWEKTDLEDVLRSVAEANDLEADVDVSDEDDDGKGGIDRLDQRNESDLVFANRIAEERGLACKVHDGKMVVRSGRALEMQEPVAEIPMTGSPFSPTRFSFRQSSSGTGYTKAKARYSNAEKGELMQALVQSRKAYEAEQGGKPQQDKTLTLDRKADSPKDAARQAKGAMQKANSKEETVTIELMGNTRLVAGTTVDMTGFGTFSGRYIIQKADHKIGNSGYTCSLELSKARLKPDKVLVERRDVITSRQDFPTPDLTEDVAAFVSSSSEMLFDSAKTHIATMTNDKDENTNIILCLPEIAETMSARMSDKNDRKGWMYLADMFRKWISTRAKRSGNEDEIEPSPSSSERIEQAYDLYSDRDPFRVDFEWVLSYRRIKTSYLLFRDKNTFFSDAAINLLRKIIRRQMGTGEQKDFFSFDFIDQYSKNWTDWRSIYHQTSDPVNRLSFTLNMDGSGSHIDPDGATAALLTFNFRALARGYVYRDIDGRMMVTVTGAATFLVDIFNFGYSDDDKDQKYLYWSCADKLFYKENILMDDSRKWITNKNFRSFRKKNGYGGDFLVISNAYEHEIREDEQPTFEL